MSPEAVAAVISAAGFAASMLGAVFVAGRRSGATELRIAMLEANQDKMATKDQLAGLKEDMAEIKGMFRMTLRETPP